MTISIFNRQLFVTNYTDLNDTNRPWYPCKVIYIQKPLPLHKYTETYKLSGREVVNVVMTIQRKTGETTFDHELENEAYKAKVKQEFKRQSNT